MKKLLLSVTALMSLSISNLEAFKDKKGKRLQGHAAHAAPVHAAAQPAAPAPAPEAPVNPFADILNLIEGLDKNKGDSEKNQAALKTVVTDLHTKFTTLTAKDAKLLPLAVKVKMTRACNDLSVKIQELLKAYLQRAYQISFLYGSDPVVQE